MSFPGAETGSDYDLMMMTFPVRPKQARKPNQPRLKKWRDPDVACTFQAIIGGKFALLIGLRDEDINTMITTYNTAMTGWLVGLVVLGLTAL